MRGIALNRMCRSGLGLRARACSVKGSLSGCKIWKKTTERRSAGGWRADLGGALVCLSVHKVLMGGGEERTSFTGKGASYKATRSRAVLR